MLLALLSFFPRRLQPEMFRNPSDEFRLDGSLPFCVSVEVLDNRRILDWNVRLFLESPLYTESRLILQLFLMSDITCD